MLHPARLTKTDVKVVTTQRVGKVTRGINFILGEGGVVTSGTVGRKKYSWRLAAPVWDT